MKVFSMNDCDWMAGESLESCKEEYLRMCFNGEANDAAFDDPGETSPEAMKRMMFHDEDGQTRTFQEELDRLVANGAKFPRFFASTEY